MSEQVTIEGKEYISSKRASDLSGYAQDYIGQLARGGLIEAQRIGGLWFIFMPSLEGYKANAETYKPQPPVRTNTPEPDSLLTFDGKDYVSASKAAKITGYNQDYVGQLARTGTVLSRQVGNRWYVEREGVLAHKKEKDALLAAVQAESVGIRSRQEEFTSPGAHTGTEEYMTYTSEKQDLVPTILGSGSTVPISRETTRSVFSPVSSTKHTHILEHTDGVKRVKSIAKSRGGTSEKSISYGTLAASLFSILFLIGVGSFVLGKGGTVQALSAGVTKAIGGVPLEQHLAAGAVGVGDFLERYLVKDLVYHRP